MHIGFTFVSLYSQQVARIVLVVNSNSIVIEINPLRNSKV
jgi:hypothetical protein